MDLACALIAGGQPVAFPTDTVYGLGASLQNAKAIERLYEIKGRDSAKAIAVLIGDIEALSAVTSGMGALAQKLSDRFWPGPITLVVSRHPNLPENISPLTTIGVRMPDHRFAIQFLQRTGPLAVTSANLSGAASTTSARQVFDQLINRIPLILDGGRTPGGLSSTVVDCTGQEPVILREGPISLTQILEALA